MLKTVNFLWDALQSEFIIMNANAVFQQNGKQVTAGYVPDQLQVCFRSSLHKLHDCKKMREIIISSLVTSHAWQKQEYANKEMLNLKWLLCTLMFTKFSQLSHVITCLNTAAWQTQI